MRRRSRHRAYERSPKTPSAVEISSSRFAIHESGNPWQGETANTNAPIVAMPWAKSTIDNLDLAHVGEHAEQWEKVVRKLRAGMMPPAGALIRSTADVRRWVRDTGQRGGPRGYAISTHVIDGAGVLRVNAKGWRLKWASI